MKENKWLAATALASSKNRSSVPQECGETSEKPKNKRKQKLQKAPQENTMEDPPVSLPKPQDTKSFPKEKLASSDLEETTGSGNLPPKRNQQLVTLKKQETRVSPRKRGNSLQGGATQQQTRRRC